MMALHAGPAEVSALSAVGPAVGALIAVPLAPWVEFRRKRPVMIMMDLARFAVLATIPIAYAFDRLSFVQLLAISAVIAAAKIAFNAASGAYLKALVRSDDLLVANARFESTNWSSIAVGPPLGGAAIGLFGPVTTVVTDALSYLLSALAITAIRGQEEAPLTTDKSPVRAGALLDGWRHIMGHPGLRSLYLNQMLVAGLIMATEPLLAVLLLRQLMFPPWQYGLAFAAPCLGGLIGSRLARRVVTRFGRHWVFRTVGTLRAIWLIGLAFVRPGVGGLITVMAIELAIIINMSMYSPVLATYRLEHTRMSTGPALDPKHTALLVMDYQPTIMGSLPEGEDRNLLLDRMEGAIADVRANGGSIVYVRVGFTEADWDAIPASNKSFAPLAQHRVMHHQDPATAIHERLAPQGGDIIVRKIRYGGMSTTDLDQQLRERGITTLVVSGISTSGVVLSTIIDAADRDYQLYVLSDGVADPDTEIHNALLHKVFPSRAHIIDTTELRALLRAG
jgi:nicotinamidase-related amidase/predicted MFS family arabinose efflux permease